MELWIQIQAQDLGNTTDLLILLHPHWYYSTYDNKGVASGEWKWKMNMTFLVKKATLDWETSL